MTGRQMPPALRAAFDRLQAAVADETRPDEDGMFDDEWREIERIAREVDPDFADAMPSIREHCRRSAAEAELIEWEED